MRRVTAPFAALLLAFGALPVVSGAQQRPPDPPTPRPTLTPDVDPLPAAFPALGQEVLRIVRQHFYDPERAADWARTYHDYAQGIEDRSASAQRTTTILHELSTSHTGYYTLRDPEYFQLLAIFQRPLQLEAIWYDSIGADIARLAHGFFVRHVFAAGPAERAGLVRGDHLVAADGRPFDPSSAFTGKGRATVTLTVRRRPTEAPFAVRITPRRVQPREEWLDAQRSGSRLITRNTRRIAYVPLFTCAGLEYQQAVQEAVAEQFQAAEALILDLRDGWGGCNPEFVNLFNAAVPVLTRIDRDGKRTAADRQWRRPLYIVVNGGSRSGKEVVAFAVKKHRLGTLVGERTAGAVMGGRAFLLSDRSLLYLAVMDVLVDGVRLEGRGVDPHVTVAGMLPYAAGEDPQLEKALDLAASAR